MAGWDGVVMRLPQVVKKTFLKAFRIVREEEGKKRNLPYLPY